MGMGMGIYYIMHAKNLSALTDHFGSGQSNKVGEVIGLPTNICPVSSESSDRIVKRNYLFRYYRKYLLYFAFNASS